jgi:hypothetical protein
MSDVKISNTQAQIANLNLKLERALQSSRKALLASSLSQRGLLSTNTLSKTSATTAAVGTTNLDFTWTGSLLTISWAIGYVESLGGSIYTIPSGSRVLVASKTYTAFWNPIHQQLVLISGATLPAVSSNSNNINICTFFTGTSGQSGWAGGPGGSPQGSGTLGQNYKNF